MHDTENFYPDPCRCGNGNISKSETLISLFENTKPLQAENLVDGR